MNLGSDRVCKILFRKHKSKSEKEYYRDSVYYEKVHRRWID